MLKIFSLEFSLFFGCYHGVIILALHMASWNFCLYSNLNIKAKSKIKSKINPNKNILWGKLLLNKGFIGL